MKQRKKIEYKNVGIIFKKIYSKISNVIKKVKILFIYFGKNLTKSWQKNSFSIVTATYNSELYLDKFFESIFANNYTMEKIEIIMVDDGSFDRTKTIINNWIEKYPQNIKYIYQENSGQAIARNKGLEHVGNKWVTFIDSDDFISKNYFKEVNYAINLTRGKSIVSTNWINFIEEQNKFVNNHPLRYRFTSKLRVSLKNLLKDPKYIQLAMNSVFFQMKDINNYKLKVQDIKPQFEDAVFVMEYLKNTESYDIAFVNRANYYYRKRKDASSTLNKSMYDYRRYVDLLKDAYVLILREYFQDIGSVPEFVQNTVIYDLSWNIKELEGIRLVLTEEQRNLREIYLKEIFSYIEFENLVKNWKYLWKMYLIGLNYKYYDGKENIKSGVYLHYQTDEYYKYLLIDVEDKWEIFLDNKPYKIADLENRLYVQELNNEFLVNKRFVKVPKYFSEISIKYSNDSQFVPQIGKRKTKFNKDSLILFYDRYNKADDNAEVMYQWMKKNHPEYEKLYFVIQKGCKDYKRLKEKGFKLIDYGTEEFRRKYLEADYIISSAFDRRIENYQRLRYHSPTKIHSEAKYIFLQHGVITDNLSEWFSVKRVDKVVTTAKFEYNNLLNKYNLFNDEVLLTGMPRYDKLYSDSKNEILVQFTWRMEYQNYNLSQIQKTEYFKDIVKILTDKRLLKTLEDNKYILKLILHPEINKYIKYFKNYETKIVRVLNTEKIIFKEQFASAKLMITDYSSVFADFCYLKKPILYYQRDREQFYKNHLYKAEMDYEKDGLGNVHDTYEGLITNAIDYINNGCKMESIYEQRINQFFKYNDQNNCLRLYERLIEENYSFDIKDNILHIDIKKEPTKGNEIIQGELLIYVNKKLMYTINVQSDKSIVYYKNIVIPKHLITNNIIYELTLVNKTNAAYDLTVGSKRKPTEEQLVFNKNHKIKKEIIKINEYEHELFISKRGNKRSPQKILISFGAYGHFDTEVRMPISYFKSLNKELDDTLIIAFQDNYFVDGTYFLVDNKGKPLNLAIKNYINSLLCRHGLDSSSLIFYGASKGGTVAIDIAANYPKSKVYLNAPQIKIDVFLKSRLHHYGLVYNYLKEYGLEKYEVEKSLLKILDQSKVFYAYSKGDVTSNCGLIEKLEHKNLQKLELNVPHRMIASSNWEYQEQLIKEDIRVKDF